jgi:hypothetical protein
MPRSKNKIYQLFSTRIPIKKNSNSPNAKTKEEKHHCVFDSLSSKNEKVEENLLFLIYRCKTENYR